MALKTARAENINPRMLIWARETAGLEIDEAARKIGLRSSTPSTAAEKLEALESGDAKPTRNQLLKMESVYRRPLTIFYLVEPPRVAERGEDFRTLAAQPSKREKALLDALLRDIKVRQEIVRSILEDDEDVGRLEFISSISPTDSVSYTAVSIKEALGIASDDWTSNFKSSGDLFRDLRDRVEAMGVFVLLAGDLGSHHTKISAEVFRGFAIADEIAPFIVINSRDAKVALTFTLFHELAHLFVGRSGISGPPTTENPKTPSAEVERFCNDVAGEVLLPASAVRNVGDVSNFESAKQIISEIAKARNLGEHMVAYRLCRLGKIRRGIYGELREHYTSRWKELKQAEKEAYSELTGGPSRHVVNSHRLGKALMNLVGQTLRANQITHTTAAQILGVKPTSVEPLLQQAPGLSGLFVVR